MKEWKWIKWAVMFLLALVIAVPVLGTKEAQAATTDGSCGDSATYEYDSSTKTLTVSGSGTVEAPDEWDDISGSVKYLVIGDKITDIGTYGGWTALKTVTLGAKVKKINDSAFKSCKSLTTVDMGDSAVTKIGANAFYECTKLKTVTLGRKLTSIGAEAFFNCGKLTDISLPSSLKKIGNGAFEGSGLKKITIPKNVTSIGSMAFSSCTSLTKITVSGSNTTYSSKDGVLYNKAKTKLIQYPAGKTCTSFTMPGTVKTIGQCAFAANKKLKKITIGSKVTKIGNSAFFNCPALTSVTIPNSVKTIGDSAFGYCTKLKTVKIGSKVTKIGADAFWATALTSVTIPNSVKTIGDCAFNQCMKLKTVTIGTGVKSIGTEVFYFCSALKTVTFKGSAPEFKELEEEWGSAFAYVTATIKYPSSKKSSWTGSLRKKLEKIASYEGGSLTFKAY